MAVKSRTYARATEQALLLLGKQIQLSRKQSGMTEVEMAARAGISRTTLRKIEEGAAGVAIGLVLETATIAGIPLFDEDRTRLPQHIERIDDKLALLPQAIRKGNKGVKDDF